MPLNTHFTGPTELLWDENGQSTPEHEAMAYATMYLGINKITEDTYQVFYERYIAFNLAGGYSEWFLDLATIKSFIGFSTNASPITPAKFRKVLSDRLLDVAGIKVRNEADEEV